MGAFVFAVDDALHHIDEGKHIPIEFKIYNADENADLFGVTPDFTIKIYICKRIGKIALEKNLAERHIRGGMATQKKYADKKLNSTNHLTEI